MPSSSAPVAHPAGHSALALRIAGFALDVDGSASHDGDDTWDANWLAAAARCEAAHAIVSVPRVVLTSWSVRRFCEGLTELARSQSGCALLAAEGPELSACVRGVSGQSSVTLRVDISCACATQGHWFEFDIDAKALQHAIVQCEAILAEFPTREVTE